MDTEEFNGTFFITLVGILTAFVSGALVYAIKSKCTRCEICYGLIAIQRDVRAEIDEEKVELEHGLNPFSTNEKK